MAPAPRNLIKGTTGSFVSAAGIRRALRGVRAIVARATAKGSARLIAVVVPVHNEEATLEACLRSIRKAARFTARQGETVRLIAVLDSCTDGSLAVAKGLAHDTVVIRSRCVGKARAVGALRAMEHGARWIACTDGDTTVRNDWISAQLRLRADAVCGTVAIGAPWRLGDPVERAHRLRYVDRDGHRHVHGANLGVAATAYRLAGGFPPVAVNEDVDLVNALVRNGCRVVWSAAPRVTTSARFENRVPGGFGGYLRCLVNTCQT